MQIAVPLSAVERGQLRIWLRRVPEASDTVYAFRLAPDGSEQDLIGEASVYGRGKGSSAREKSMLLFRMHPVTEEAPLCVGEHLRLMVKRIGDSSYQDVDLDVLLVE